MLTGFASIAMPYQSTEDLSKRETVTTPVVGLVGSDEATLEIGLRRGGAC